MIVKQDASSMLHTIIDLIEKRINIIIFFIAFLFYFIYINSYGLVLSSDEIGHILFAYDLIGSGKTQELFVKPLPLLLDILTYPISPQMYELIAAVFTSFLILSIFNICKYLFNKKVAFFAAFLVLINPMTFTQTMFGSSLIIQASLLFIAYFYLINIESYNNKPLVIIVSLLLFTLSCLTRPETWFFVPLLFYYTVYVKRLRQKFVIIWIVLLFFIMPLLWMLKDYLITGDPLWWPKAVTEYIEMSLHQNTTTFLLFPRRFLSLINGQFISVIFVFLSIIGVLADVKNSKHTSILTLTFVILFGFYWIYGGKGNPLFGRFFFISFLIIAIYGSVGIFYIFEQLPIKNNAKKYVALALVMAFFLYYGEAGKIIKSRWLINITSSRNDDIIESYRLLADNVSPGDPLNILISSRRESLMKLMMRDDDNFNLISFRSQYYQKKSFKDEMINWIIYDKDDIYPPPVRKYYETILGSKENLDKEGIILNKVYKISDKAYLLKIENK